jgi:hypothetical protein
MNKIDYVNVILEFIHLKMNSLDTEDTVQINDNPKS